MKSSTKTRTPKFPCSVCDKGVISSSKAVSCYRCDNWTQIMCCEVSVDDHNLCLNSGKPISHVCNVCLLREMVPQNFDETSGDQTLVNSANYDDVADDCVYEVQKSTAYTWLDCCCFNAAQIVLTPPAPRNRGPFLPFFGQQKRTPPNNQGGVGRQQHCVYESFSKKGLHFLHLNARSLLSKLSDVRLLVNNSKAAVFAVSETWLDGSVTDAEIELVGYT